MGARIDFKLLKQAIEGAEGGGGDGQAIDDSYSLALEPIGTDVREGVGRSFIFILYKHIYTCSFLSIKSNLGVLLCLLPYVGY